VVATADISQKIDLKSLKILPEVVYDPCVYRGRVAYLKAKSMKGKVAIFQSGKLISIGTTSEVEAARELEKTAGLLAEKGFIGNVFLCPRTRNIVVAVNLEQNINLEQFLDNIKQGKTHMKAIYEPDQFSGAIIYIAEPVKVTVLVFSNGKTILTGLKNESQIDFVIQLLEKVLNQPPLSLSAQ